MCPVELPWDTCPHAWHLHALHDQATLHCDAMTEKLKASIDLDVIRCFPEVPRFQEEEAREQLRQVLLATTEECQQMRAESTYFQVQVSLEKCNVKLKHQQSSEHVFQYILLTSLASSLFCKAMQCGVLQESRGHWRVVLLALLSWCM